MKKIFGLKSLSAAWDIRLHLAAVHVLQRQLHINLDLRIRDVTVHMPGGELQVEIQEDWEIFVTGEVFYIGKMILGNELSEKLRMM